MDDQEKTAKKITVTYDDGTTKEIERGLVFTISEPDENDNCQIEAEFVNIKGKEIYTVVFAVLEMGVKLGMFNDKPKEKP